MKIQRYTFYWLDLFLIISISITIPEKKRRGIIVLDLSQEPFSCPYISEVYPAFVKMTKKLDRNFSSKCLSHEKESLHKKPKAKFNSRKIRVFNLESHKKKKKKITPDDTGFHPSDVLNTFRHYISHRRPILQRKVRPCFLYCIMTTSICFKKMCATPWEKIFLLCLF